MKMKLSQLTTEQRNPMSMNLDQLNTMQILQTINDEDKTVAHAVEKVLPQMELAVDQTCRAMRDGGRLFYVGAGTSGRLGIIDASECPPTFMTSPDLVQTVMAGGNDAFFHSAEGIEDLEERGELDLKAKNINHLDVVIGITASGRTPYPIGALQYARKKGSFTVSLSCNHDSFISHVADCALEVIVGPEILTGSTRMKAATAHKMILNMISTTTMVKLGKVHENLMVDVHASNDKLMERARHTVMEVTHASYEKADIVLKQTNFEVKPAIVMIEAGVDFQKANEAIAHHKGFVREAIRYFA